MEWQASDSLSFAGLAESEQDNAAGYPRGERCRVGEVNKPVEHHGCALADVEIGQEAEGDAGAESIDWNTPSVGPLKNGWSVAGFGQGVEGSA